MSSPATHLDLAAARENFLAEDVEVIVESNDFSNISVTPPGEYLTPFRTLGNITTKVVEGQTVTTFEIQLTGGVKDLNTGQTFGGGKYPFRTWQSTKLFEQSGKPGKTSQISQYLREAGFDPKTLRTRQDIMDAVEASLNVPLKVYIAWKDRGVKQADGSWKDYNLKTKDFQTGTREDGSKIYSSVITYNGEEVRATEKVGSFKSFA